MKAVFFFLLLALAAGAAEKAPVEKGFDAFHNVRTKNIFDPTRRAPRNGSSSSSAAAAAEAMKRGRSLALTGTMVTDGKALAFFGGSAAEGTRVVGVGQSVAGHTLKVIAPTQVTLEREGRPLVLAVGRQITFDADGTNGPVTAIVVEKAAEPSAETTGAPPPPAPPAGVPGDKAELLRKMMERRAKEVGK